MTKRRLFKIMSGMFVLIFFMITLATAQEKAVEKKDDGITKMPDGSYRSRDYDEANRPDDSYLAKSYASEVIQKLMTKNLDEIYLIKVIVSNFSDKGWSAEYDKLYNGYKDGMEQYYKRNRIYARAKLEKNQAEIREAFKKILEEYKKQSETILGECAGKLLQLHLDVSSRVDPNRFEMLYANQLRLKVAYAQTDEAVDAINNKYFSGAICHYRMAKAYGIAILEDVTAKPEEKDSVRNKYKVDKADNMNRIYAEKKEEPKK